MDEKEEIKKEHTLLIKKLVNIMIERKISIKEFSDLINEDVSYVVRVFSGEIYLDIMVMFKIERALKIEIFNQEFTKKAF